MKPFKAVCLGVFLWAATILVSFVFSLFSSPENTAIKMSVAMIVGFVALALVVYVRPRNLIFSLTYGFLWIIIGLCLDLIIRQKFNDSLFNDWSLWLGYGFVLLASLVGFYSIDNNNGDSAKSEDETKTHQDIKIN